MLLDFANCHIQNETQSKKPQLCANNACSQHGIMWQTDATGVQKYERSLFSDLLWWQLQQQSGKFPIEPGKT
jgi:hypothetical protein